MNEAGFSTDSQAIWDWADERLSELMGTINAATAELVSVVAGVIETGAWGGAGVRSPEHWVAWRAGVSPNRAAALVGAARRLSELPRVATAFAEGRLSEDAVRLVVARTPPERDAEVAELAQVMTVPQLRRVLGSLPKATAEVEPVEAEPEVSFGHDDGDRWSLRAVGLPAERGAIVARALEAAREAVFRDRTPEAPEGARPKGITWADALERMALAALESIDHRRSPSERYSVIVHVRPGDTPAANVHLGPALSAAARRRITCDAALRWVLEEDGRPVAWGRRRRTVDPVLRRLIEDRDRGCRVPGCTQVRWVEVHHLRHVEDGGETVP